MYFKYNRHNIYYEKYGTNKDTILILPGWGNTRPTFNYIIDNFKNNHSIYIIDYPGFGNSPIINNDLTIYDYADIIISFMKQLKIENPTIIAHSFGGRITSILAGKYKIKIKRIILIDVAGIKRVKKLKIIIKEKIYKLLTKLTNLLDEKNKVIIRKKLINYFSSNDYKYLPNNMKKTFQNIINEDLKKYYKNIDIDTLIIWGENDLDTPLKDAFLLNKIIKNSGLVIYKKRAHFSYLEEMNKTIIILNSFIKKEDDYSSSSSISSNSSNTNLP